MCSSDLLRKTKDTALKIKSKQTGNIVIIVKGTILNFTEVLHIFY